MEISEALFVVVFLIGGVFGIMVGMFCSIKIIVDDIYKYKRKDDEDAGN